MANTTKSDAVLLQTTDTTIYTCPSSGMSEAYCLQLRAANANGSQAMTYEVKVVKASSGNVAYQAAPNTPLPIGAADELSEGSKLILKPGDVIKGKCLVNNGVSLAYSVVEVA